MKDMFRPGGSGRVKGEAGFLGLISQWGKDEMGSAFDSEPTLYLYLDLGGSRVMFWMDA